MTRKRFTKLVMSLGVPRNKAAAMAVAARVNYGSYVAGTYAYINLLLEMCRAVAEEIMPQIVASIEKILPAGGGAE